MKIDPLHVVGIGASAGGLEAMLSLLPTLKPTGRLSYVVAQHMAHDAHSDLVARQLRRASVLPVVVADDGGRLMADTIYLIPSNRDGIVAGKSLYLRPPARDNFSAPSVNVLFTSMAEACGENCTGIILSGAGSDGTAGCRAIRTRGGRTIAQAPEEAMYNGMPGTASESRVIEHVMTAVAIGNFLMAKFPPLNVLPAVVVAAPAIEPSGTAPASEDLAALRQLLPMVLRATGVDFSGYKEETLLRRLDRRRVTLGIASSAEYVALAERKVRELEVLQQLFLVSVSSFFRDPASFGALTEALRALFAAKPHGAAVRVWVPGCAGGEEVYTLAMICAELLGDRADRTVHIVATDLNAQAIAAAERGIYSKVACAKIDPELRKRYLVLEGGNFAVGKRLRKMVAFMQQDIFSGAPGKNFDLISCRNVLIYLKSPLQMKLVQLFYAALQTDALLFLGDSESLGPLAGSLFAPIDRDHHIYRRRA